MRKLCICHVNQNRKKEIYFWHLFLASINYRNFRSLKRLCSLVKYFVGCTFNLVLIFAGFKIRPLAKSFVTFNQRNWPNKVYSRSLCGRSKMSVAGSLLKLHGAGIRWFHLLQLANCQSCKYSGYQNIATLMYSWLYPLFLCF